MASRGGVAPAASTASVPRPLQLDLFPKSELGKNCRYGGLIEVALPELLGEGNCGAGIMLLLAITTRRVHA